MKWTHKRSSGTYEYGKSVTVEQISDSEWMYRVYYPDWDTPRITAHSVSAYPKTLHEAKLKAECLIAALEEVCARP